MWINTVLAANPSSYSGPPPVTVNFEGAIELGGVTDSFTLKYHFIRSDGAYDSVIRSIDVEPSGGIFPVSSQWQLSPPEYTGWEAIEVIEPYQFTSNQATFSIKTGLTDLGVPSFDVIYDTNTCKVKFAARVMNYGDFDFTGPCTVIIGAGIKGWLTEQRPVTIPSSVVIHSGDIYVTEYAAEQRLWPKRMYWVDIILDPERKIQELNRRNDRLVSQWIWWEDTQLCQ